MSSEGYSILQPLLDTTIYESDPECQTKVNNRRDTLSSHRIESCLRKSWFILSIGALLVVYVTLANTRSALSTIKVLPPSDPMQSTTEDADNASLAVPEGFLVWSPQCKIANLDPMTKDVMHLYHRQKTISCAPRSPLTSVEWNNGTQVFDLQIVHSARTTYHFHEGLCQYQEINRKSENHIR